MEARAVFILLVCLFAFSKCLIRSKKSRQAYWFGRTKLQPDKQSSISRLQELKQRSGKHHHSGPGNMTAEDLDVGKDLEKALQRNPAEGLKLKEDLSDLEEIKMGDDLLKIGVHPRDNSRLKRIVMKAIKGELIRVVIIGGSNSAGGGMDKDEGTLQRLYYRLFAKWWNNTIGETTGSNVNEQLVAIGGTGSYFFAFCYDTFLQSSKNIDIAIVEASVNYNKEGKAEPLEQLTRRLYTDTSEPAIFFVNLVSGLGMDPKTKKLLNPTCLNLENFGQTEVAKRYRVTSFVMKDFACPLKNGKRVINTEMDGLVSSDQRHVGNRAHAQIALMMINYVKSVFDDVIKAEKSDMLNISDNEEYPQIPFPLFVDKSTKLLKNPQCWSGITPNGNKNIHEPSLSVKVLKQNRFRFYKNGYTEIVKKAKPELRTDKQCGWGAWGPGASVQFQINVRPWNSGGSEKTRSVIALVHSMYEGGKGRIWIDGRENEAVKINTKARPGGSNDLYSIKSRLSPGIHTFHVEADGKGMFILSGIFVGPPDFSRQKVI